MRVQTSAVPEDELLTPRELAEEMKRSEAALAQLRSRGLGPKYVKVGRRVLYRRSDIRAYLDANTVSGTEVGAL
jgi:predicted DNA-binding transcriptional regulator AlpA